MTPFYLISFTLSLLFSFIFTWCVRNLATERGWITSSIQYRDLHEWRPSRLGGVPIFLSVLISVAVALLASLHFPALAAGLLTRTLLTVLVSGTVIFLVGLYSDIYSLSPYTKFAAQGVAAIMLFAGGLRIVDLPVMFGARHLVWYVGLPITVLWVIGITNAFNLILERQAAVSALFATLVVFVVAMSGGLSLVSLFTIAMAGAILGFLGLSFSPASIALGDSGSFFIGFLLSALALVGAQKASAVIAVAIPVVSFGLPVLETTVSNLRRLISGRPVFTAYREDIDQKLSRPNASLRQVLIALYAVSALFALFSLSLLRPGGNTLALVLLVIGTCIWFGIQRFGYLDFSEGHTVAQCTREQTSKCGNDLAIRQATEELKGASDYAQVCDILRSAFSANDFDGFELRVNTFADQPSRGGDRCCELEQEESLYFEWSKPGPPDFRDGRAAWNLRLELSTSAHRWLGSMKIYRFYTDRPLLVNASLLTSGFPVVLADALDRALVSKKDPVSEVDNRLVIRDSQG